MTNKVAFLNENDNDSHLDLQQIYIVFCIYILDIVSKLKL